MSDQIRGATKIYSGPIEGVKAGVQFFQATGQRLDFPERVLSEYLKAKERKLEKYIADHGMPEVLEVTYNESGIEYQRCVCGSMRVVFCFEIIKVDETTARLEQFDVSDEYICNKCKKCKKCFSK